jgi:hypothetical protein
MSPVFKNLLPLLCLTLLPACGEEDPSTNSDGTAGTSTGPLLPWAAGNRWTYQVTDKDVISTKVTTVGEPEPVGGDGPSSAIIANKVTTQKKDGADETVSWRSVDGERVVRYRELSLDGAGGAVDTEEYWDPYRVYIDWSAEHVAQGASWLVEYQETKIEAGVTTGPATKRDLWLVQAASEEVTVPAGTFKDAVVLQKTGGNGTDKTYWYVRGVGKVKETGGQTEELVDYELAE